MSKPPPTSLDRIVHHVAAGTASATVCNVEYIHAMQSLVSIYGYGMQRVSSVKHVHVAFMGHQGPGN